MVRSMHATGFPADISNHKEAVTLGVTGKWRLFIGLRRILLPTNVEKVIIMKARGGKS